MSRDFEEKLREGQDGEREVGNFLMSKGMHLVPLYQYVSHDQAPVLFSRAKRLILPDLDVYADGKSFFVEVKRKNQWVRFQGAEETGLNKSHAIQYRTIASLTGKPVYLVFLHKVQEPTGLFRIGLDKFFANARDWDGCRGAGGMRVSPPLLLCASKHLERVEDFTGEVAA